MSLFHKAVGIVILVGDAVILAACIVWGLK